MEKKISSRLFLTRQFGNLSSGDSPRICNVTAGALKKYRYGVPPSPFFLAFLKSVFRLDRIWKFFCARSQINLFTYSAPTPVLGHHTSSSSSYHPSLPRPFAQVHSVDFICYWIFHLSVSLIVEFLLIIMGTYYTLVHALVLSTFFFLLLKVLNYSETLMVP